MATPKETFQATGVFPMTNSTIDEKTDNINKPDRRWVPVTIERDNLSVTELLWLARFLDIVEVNQQGIAFVCQLMFPQGSGYVETPDHWVYGATQSIMEYHRPFPCKEEIMLKMVSWSILDENERRYPGITKKVFSLIDRWLNAFHNWFPENNFVTYCFIIHPNGGENKRTFVPIELPMARFIANIWNDEISEAASQYTTMQITVLPR